MANAQPEPSMEEILASIRRIISEDEDGGDGDMPDAPRALQPEEVSEPSAPVAQSAPPAKPAAKPEAKPLALKSAAQSVTKPIALAEAARADSAGARGSSANDVAAPTMKKDEDGAGPRLTTEDVEMVKNNLAANVQDERGFVDEVSAASASHAFQSLSQSVRVTDAPGRTLEDMVVEIITPLVKQWLDENLPAIVEEKVQLEVERIARRGR